MRLRTLIRRSASAGSHGPLPRRRRAGRFAALAFATLGLLVAVAPGASAHATLVSTSPGNDTVLATAPTRVTLSFNEAVTVPADGIRVFDPAGGRADLGTATHVGGDTVTVRLKPGLARGTYVAAWHVVSADSHPIEGAFTFSVGARSATAVNPNSVNSSSSGLVNGLYTTARFLAFAGFAVLIGGVLFLALCWPAGADRDGSLALLERAWALLLLGTLGSFLLQGVYGSGAPLSHATHPQLLESTLKTHLGIALTARFAVLVLLFPLRNRLYRLATANREDRFLVAGVWAFLGIGLAATWAAADHASVGIQAPLAVLADSAHLFSVACWIGGLVMLAVVVLRVPRGNSAGLDDQDDQADQAAAVARFSRVATWAVGLIALTGTYQAWRGVGSWSALFGTSYGRLVLLKIIGFSGLLAVGYVSRRLVARVKAAGAVAREPNLRRLRRTVTTEACVAACVLVVTALLVDTRTGRESVPGSPPATGNASFNTGGIGGQGTLDAELTPAHPGRNQLRLNLLDPAGHSYTPAEVTVTLNLAARGIGPLTVPVTATGPGTYTAAVDTVSLPGTWTLAVTIRSDEIDETTVRVPLTVR